MSTELEQQTTQEQDDAAAEQALAEVFGAEAKPEVTDPKPDAEVKTDPQPQVADPQPESPDWKKALDSGLQEIRQNYDAEIRKVYGKFGELHSSFQQFQKDIETLKNTPPGTALPEGALKRVREVVPDLAEAFEADLREAWPKREQQAVQAAVEAVPHPAGLNREEMRAWRAQVLAEARETVKLDSTHNGWEQTIKSPQFVEFAFSGGPTAEERDRLLAFDQEDPDRAIFVGDLAVRYPGWWNDKGQYVESPEASAAGKLLAAFAETQKPAQPPKRDPVKRLEQSVMPKGTGAAPGKSEMSEQEAFDSVWK